VAALCLTGHPWQKGYEQMTVESEFTEWNSRGTTVVGFGSQLLAALINSTAVGCFGFTLALVVAIVAILVGISQAERASAFSKG